MCFSSLPNGQKIEVSHSYSPNKYLDMHWDTLSKRNSKKMSALVILSEKSALRIIGKRSQRTRANGSPGASCHVNPSFSIVHTVGVGVALVLISFFDRTPRAKGNTNPQAF